MDPVLKSDFEIAMEREASKCLAQLVRERAVRTERIKPMRMRWGLTMKDNGTVKAWIVLLGFQDHLLGTIASASPTRSVCANMRLKLNHGCEGCFPTIAGLRDTDRCATSSRGTAWQRNRATPQNMWSVRRSEVPHNLTNARWIPMTVEPCLTRAF